MARVRYWTDDWGWPAEATGELEARANMLNARIEDRHRRVLCTIANQMRPMIERLRSFDGARLGRVGGMVKRLRGRLKAVDAQIMAGITDQVQTLQSKDRPAFGGDIPIPGIDVLEMPAPEPAQTDVALGRPIVNGAGPPEPRVDPILGIDPRVKYCVYMVCQYDFQSGVSRWRCPPIQIVPPGVPCPMGQIVYQGTDPTAARAAHARCKALEGQPCSEPPPEPPPEPPEPPPPEPPPPEPPAECCPPPGQTCDAPVHVSLAGVACGVCPTDLVGAIRAAVPTASASDYYYACQPPESVDESASEPICEAPDVPVTCGGVGPNDVLVLSGGA